MALQAQQRTMDALVPDGAGSVLVTSVESPRPEPGEVVIDVAAFSVNRGETFQLESPRTGWRPGKDVAGVVTRAAADGTGPAPGARVVAHLEDSGWARRAAVPAGRLVELADGVTFETAAALPLAGLTALRLARAARLAAGTTLLMTGASGGVGHYLAELAAGAGAHLTAVVGSVQRGTRLREFGATTVPDITEAPDCFDVGLESVGGTSLAAVRRRVRPTGRILWFGQASRVPATIDFFDWVQGTAAAPVIQFDYTVSDRSITRDLATLVDLVAAGRMHPVIDAVRPAQDAATAIDDLRHRRILGNLVLRWDTG